MTARLEALPLPDHFQPGNASKASYSVSDVSALEKAAERWAKQHRLRVAGTDPYRVRLLVVDAQYDFSFPEGALFVAGRSGTGAMDAHLRLVDFIYRRLHLISEIICTLDTHVPFQIFFPAAHLDSDGKHPPSHTEVSAEDYERGRFRPNPAFAAHLGVDQAWLRAQFIHYCRQLEAAGKHRLYLWPYHCMLGANGHRLAGVVEEARLFHAFSRGAADPVEIKGDNPLSERYSIFKEEVTTCWDGRPIPGAQPNTRLIQTLLDSDVVLLAGLASSHCVKESIADLLGEVRAKDPSLVGKLYVLEDCTAPVVVPGFDFTDAAQAAFEAFRKAGMHVIQSIDPPETWWPGRSGARAPGGRR
jgi:nicotinamidase-related amidase